MHRSLRMLQIAMHLQHRNSNLAELSAKFECSTKTIQRDLNEMISIGIPIISTRGRNGGVHIDPSWWMGPLNLTTDEIETIVLAMENAPFLPDIDAVLAKVRAAVRPSRFDAVAEDASLPAIEHGRTFETTGVLTSIRNVMNRDMWCEIDYQGGSKPGLRTILPAEIYVANLRWYVSAVDERSRDHRNFRLDRIASLRPTLGPSDAEAIIERARNRPEYKSPDHPQIIAELTEVGLRFCEDHPRFHSCLVDGMLRFHCPPSDYPYMARDLIRMGTNCRVLAPAELKEEMLRATTEMLEHLQSEPDTL